MQIGLVISSFLHVAILSWALLSFNAPKTLAVADVESVPVSIVPIEDLTKVLEGVKEATAKKKPAPKKTEVRTKVEDAQNTGENSVDLKSLKVPTPSENEVVSKAPPKSEDKPKPTAEPSLKPEPVEQVQPKPETNATTATEIAALPKEATPVTPDPVKEAINSSEPEAEKRVELPKTGPVPILREKSAPAKTAKTPERKKTEVAKKETSSSKKSDFNSDEIASLLNKQDAQGGGAKRSARDEGLGVKTTKPASKLSQSEMDALRGQIQKYWNIIPGLADGGEIRVTVSMQLDKSGNIIGQPDVNATGGSQSVRTTLAGSARRAVLRAQPYNLPLDKYDTWSEVVVNFDPSQLF
ncbi:cell envelope integrity protein TolA [Lentilitoribacter sp. EG35]|uniref:cell envelope integrity protein TolA n=1 Tax=Lentilitoribacter sp. EG35 TaxID=3234192 RepID=UPI00345FC6DB